MATEDQSGPPPDAGGYENGSTLTRRRMLKVGAATATVGAVTTRSGPLDVLDPIGEAEAAVVTLPLLAAAAVGTGVGIGLGNFYGSKIQAYEDALDAAVDKDQVVAHENAYTEMTDYGWERTKVENTLARSATNAHQEARNGIADAWEAGQTASDALSTAHARVEQYYAVVENNWLNDSFKSLGQVAYAKQAAQDALVESGEYNRDSGNPWAGTLISHPTYGDRSWSEIIPATNEVEYQLVDGSTESLATPDMYIVWDSTDNSTGDYETTISMGEWLTGHLDPAADFSTTIDGESVTWNGNISIPNVPEANLSGYQVLELVNDMVDIRSQIRDQAQTVIDGFSQTLVDNIYAELDAGNISPNDLRGIGGQASFLAGTDDASADAYIMALMQQLGLKQVDLSKVAHMTVGYRGATDRDVVTDSSGSRAIYPAGYVDSATYKGQLYAESVPGALNTGERYAVDPYTASVVGDTLEISLGDSVQFSPDYNMAGLVAVSPSGTDLYVRNYDGTDNYLISLDLLTGEESWSVPLAADPLAPDPDGTAIYTGSFNDNTLYALDPTDGSELWSTNIGVEPQTIGLGDSHIAVTDVEEGLYVYDKSGSEQWTDTTITGLKNGVVVDSANNAVYVSSRDTTNSDHTTTALDLSDGSQLWQTDHASRPEASAMRRDSSLLLVAGEFGAVALDPSDGSELWPMSPPSTVLSVEIAPDGQTAKLGLDNGDIVNAGLSDGSSLETITMHNSNKVNSLSMSYNPAVRPDLSIAGMIEGGYYYDAPNSTEHVLTNGLLTIDRMQDQGGNDVDTTDTDDWGAPDYDTTDMSEWAAYLAKSDEFREALQEWYDTGDTTLTGGSTDVDWWPPDFWPSWLPNDPLTAAIAAVLGLAGISAATS